MYRLYDDVSYWLEIHDARFYRIIKRHQWWPRELNVLQLQKTNANRKSTSKSRKHHHQFDNTLNMTQHNMLTTQTNKERQCKSSQHNQIKMCFLVWLCCEYLQCSSLFVCVVSICSACSKVEVKVTWHTAKYGDPYSEFVLCNQPLSTSLYADLNCFVEPWLHRIWTGAPRLLSTSPYSVSYWINLPSMKTHRYEAGYVRC